MLRELVRIEHRVCASELEAEVTELRLIHAHRPRYNRRSKPPKASHWVKLTRERFPRLSVVRTLRDQDTLHLGPFRSKQSAELVMHALWDALPVRRCTARPGSRAAPCGFSQMGVSLCPCGGEVDEAEYGAVVERLRLGVDRRPELLLDPLVEKMAAHAAAERFEEAAWLRDRYRALARALERRRAWQALQEAGLLHVEGDDGCAVLVERGRFVASWPAGPPPLLAAAAPPESPAPPVPPSVADAEEAHLVWRWLAEAGRRIVESTGAMAMPTRPVPHLESLPALQL
jgi:DNA polymerase-3 subunit epsilon